MSDSIMGLTPSQALQMFNYALVLIYGLLLTVGVAGGCATSREKRMVGLMCPVFLVLQSTAGLLLGVSAVEKLYPLLVHLPLVLLLVIVLKKPVGVSVVSTCTAYLCCQPLKWGKNAVEAITGSEVVGSLAYVLLLVGLFYLFNHFLVRSAYTTMTYSKQSLVLFGSLPVTYYIFDYATTVYSNALYAGIEAVNEFVPTLLVTFYILFLPAFHDQMQHRSDAEMRRSMLEAELEQSRRDMDALRQMEAQTAIYQHDMRHHLNMLDGLLAAGKPEQAEEYIKKVRTDIEAITPRRFCENELVNLLCSSFTDKAQKAKTQLSVEAKLPNRLAISDTELCSLLSNALENALRAVSELPEGQRHVSLYCGVRQNKLLIEVRNPYAGTVYMQNGVPASVRGGGHGYGCRSIQTIAERNGGLCVFTAQDKEFCMQAVLPVLER